MLRLKVVALVKKKRKGKKPGCGSPNEGHLKGKGKGQEKGQGKGKNRGTEQFEQQVSNEPPWVTVARKKPKAREPTLRPVERQLEF